MKDQTLSDIEQYLLNLPEEEKVAKARMLLPGRGAFHSPKWYEKTAYSNYSTASARRTLVYHRKGETPITGEMADNIIKATFQGVYEMFRKMNFAKPKETEFRTLKRITVTDEKKKDHPYYVGQQLYSKSMGEIKDAEVLEVLDGRCKVSDGNIEAVYTISEMKDKFTY